MGVPLFGSYLWNNYQRQAAGGQEVQFIWCQIQLCSVKHSWREGIWQQREETVTQQIKPSVQQRSGKNRKYNLTTPAIKQQGKCEVTLPLGDHDESIKWCFWLSSCFGFLFYSSKRQHTINKLLLSLLLFLCTTHTHTNPTNVIERDLNASGSESTHDITGMAL